MPSFQCERSAILLCGLGLALATALSAHAGATLGVEYSLSGEKVGDQTLPQIAIGPGAGYVVWQDNGSDGVGKSLGVMARRFFPDLTSTNLPFRVNSILGGPQENPQVALMKNGGAAFVWQGGKRGNQDIYFRTITPTGVRRPLADVRVNGITKGQQSTPVITCLTNGNLAVAWCSLHQDGRLEGIYARIVTPSGTFPSPTWVRVNQFTASSQRAPAITTLSNGNFVVAWLSDNQGVSNTLDVLRGTNRVHVYARVFSQSAKALSSEFRVNTRSNICASPSITRSGAQGFTIVWAERGDIRTNNWDIYARTFSGADTPVTDPIRVNDVAYGDQFSPNIASVGSDQLVVWTSLGRDGSREGVAGRFLSDGELNGEEFVVNTYTRGPQIQPAVGGNTRDKFLVGWASYLGDSGFDIQGQQYSAADSSSNTPGSGSSGSIVQAPQTSGGGPPPPPTPLTPVTGIGGSSDSNFRVTLANTIKGMRLFWNTDPGRIYQVQYSTNLSQWINLGESRAASAASDSTLVGNGESAAFYRVIRLQ